MENIARNRWVALAHFVLTVAGCFVLLLWPVGWLWAFVPALLVLGLRSIAGRSLFLGALHNGLLAIFLLTAIAGYRAAYDPSAAWMKLRLIVGAVLLFHAISSQPRSNLVFVSGFWFAIGTGVAAYFLLTHDFQEIPAKVDLINRVAVQWVAIRPTVKWPSIQPVDAAAGISILATSFGFYLLERTGPARRVTFSKLIVLAGYGMVAAAVLLATSRGALVALAAVFGIGCVWQILQRLHTRWATTALRLIPWAVLLLIVSIAVMLTLPFNAFGSVLQLGQSGLLSRAELIQNSITLAKDFPFMGGGLAAFPGLFSRYILVLPFYSLPDGHNLFVDMMVEQGMIGGLSYVILSFVGIWKAATSLIVAPSGSSPALRWSAFLCMFVAVVHGMVDDYLYSGWGCVLMFVPLGMVLLICRDGSDYAASSVSNPGFETPLLPSMRYRFGAQASITVLVLTAAFAIGLTWKKIAAYSFANAGAISMSQMELADFPANEWDGRRQAEELLSSRIWFERSLVYDPQNRLASHRLGLIEMSEWDFDAAAAHLADAYHQDPSHRGVIKNLGYCYVWLGEFDAAARLLKQIPESQDELKVYIWWWETQGRNDLSANAAAFLPLLQLIDVQY